MTRRHYQWLLILSRMTFAKWNPSESIEITRGRFHFARVIRLIKFEHQISKSNLHHRVIIAQILLKLQKKRCDDGHGVRDDFVLTSSRSQFISPHYYAVDTLNIVRGSISKQTNNGKRKRNYIVLTFGLTVYGTVRTTANGSDGITPTVRME